MNKKIIWASIVGAVIIAAAVIVNLPRHTTTAPAQVTSNNPQDIAPGLYPNPIKNTATAAGFTIKSGMVENNTDAAGKVVSDHLELQLTNTTTSAIKDFEVYYTITDTKTKQQEGYYKKLTGFVLQPGATTAIQFDNQTGAGHFTANKNSLYYKSTNPLKFSVQVGAPGYQVQTIDLTKAAGGAETKD